MQEIPLDRIKWATRTRNAFRNYGIKTLNDLENRSESELLEWSNFGRKSLYEVKDAMSAHGLFLLGEDEFSNAEVQAIEDKIKVYEDRIEKLKRRIELIFERNNMLRKTREDKEARFVKVFRLRLLGKTYSDIGQEIGGLSVERTRQLVVKAARTFSSQAYSGHELHNEARVVCEEMKLQLRD